MSLGFHVFLAFIISVINECLRLKFLSRKRFCLAYYYALKEEKKYECDLLEIIVWILVGEKEGFVVKD